MNKKRGPKNNSSRAHKVWAANRDRQREADMQNRQGRGFMFLASFAKGVAYMLKGLRPNRQRGKT
jgi:hypothetical protein